jgi:hypothetical protein
VEHCAHFLILYYPHYSTSRTKHLSPWHATQHTHHHPQRARRCFELARAAYSAYDEEGFSALDRFLLETTVRAEEVHYLQPKSKFVELAPVPGHLVVTAHELKAVCLVIRGTEVR